MKSWNEIRKAVTGFSKRWKTAFDEKSQAQSFLKEFFDLFGVDAVTQATFEHRVKFADGRTVAPKSGARRCAHGTARRWRRHEYTHPAH